MMFSETIGRFGGWSIESYQQRYPIESIQIQYVCYAELYNGTINVNVQWKVCSTKSISVCRLPWAKGICVGVSFVGPKRIILGFVDVECSSWCDSM